jgi:hypothetical protein
MIVRLKAKTLGLFFFNSTMADSLTGHQPLDKPLPQNAGFLWPGVALKLKHQSVGRGEED